MPVADFNITKIDITKDNIGKGYKANVIFNLGILSGRLTNLKINSVQDITIFHIKYLIKLEIQKKLDSIRVL